MAARAKARSRRRPGKQKTEGPLTKDPARTFVVGWLHKPGGYIRVTTNVAPMTAGKGIHRHQFGERLYFSRRCLFVPETCDNIPEEIMSACGGKPIGFAADRKTMNNVIRAGKIMVCVPYNNDMTQWDVVCCVDSNTGKPVFDEDEIADHLEQIKTEEEEEKKQSDSSKDSPKRCMKNVPKAGKKERKEKKTTVFGSQMARHPIEEIAEAVNQTVVDEHPFALTVPPPPPIVQEINEEQVIAEANHIPENMEEPAQQITPSNDGDVPDGVENPFSEMNDDNPSPEIDCIYSFFEGCDVPYLSDSYSEDTTDDFSSEDSSDNPYF